MQLYANEKNVFVGMFNNMLFWYIAIGEIVAQMLISTFGGAVFRVTGGLTATQWLICWAFSLGHLPWHAIVVNVVPLSIFSGADGDTPDDADIEAQEDMMMMLESVRLCKLVVGWWQH